MSTMMFPDIHTWLGTHTIIICLSLSMSWVDNANVSITNGLFILGFNNACHNDNKSENITYLSFLYKNSCCSDSSKA